jgi:hypothetical protein
MRIRLTLVFFASAALVVASDVFNGTWKQSVALSGGQVHLKHVVPPVLEIEVAADNKATFRSPQSTDVTIVTLDGVPTRRTAGSNAGEDFSVKRLHAKVWRFHRDTHGKTYPDRDDPTPYNEEGHYLVSGDGKLMTIAVLRTYSDGRTQYYHRVFEKQ